MGLAGNTAEGSKGRSFSEWGLSLRLSPRLGGHAGLPAPGITAAFTEPHEELIRWRSGDKCRH